MHSPRHWFVWQRIVVLVFTVGILGTILLVLKSQPTQLVVLTQLLQRQVKGTEQSNAKPVSKPQIEALKSGLLDRWQQEAKAKNVLYKVPTSFKGTIVDAVKLNSPNKVIALTFDDGPWPETTFKVLNILKQNQIKATFFWVGGMVQAFPQIAQKVVAEGHSIGNHTWHHWYQQMDEATAAHEIERTTELIYKTTGLTTSLFRPPGGFMHNGVADYAKNHSYVVVMWSDEAREFTPSASSSMLVDDVLSNAQSGEIVLLHDGGGNHEKTVAALPQIIAGLKQRGYEFATVPELLQMQAEEQAIKTVSAKSTSPEKSPEKKTQRISS